MLDQLEVLDAALPGLRAAAEAPFAITVGGREFTDRAEAAPALLDAARDAYQRGRNHGASRAFPIAEIAGVGVQASRWLTSDELAITLTVPARTTNLEATELRQPDATGMGLLRRVENLARGGDQHRDGLARRYDLATTRLAELADVADVAFAHAGELADKRRALETVTAQLRIDAAGPAAARNAEAQQRMAAAGRQPGWSLELNPTPAMLEQLGVDPVTYRAELARRQYQHQPAVTGRGERDPAHAMAERGHPPAPHASGAARLIAQTQGRARDHTPQPAPPGPPPQLDGPGYGQHLDRGEDHGHEL